MIRDPQKTKLTATPFPTTTLFCTVGGADTKVLRDKVMRSYTLMEIARFTSLRVQAAKAAGRGPGPEVSTGKLAASEMVRQLRDVGLEALGPHGQLMGEDRKSTRLNSSH